VGDEPKSIGQQPLHHESDRVWHPSRLNDHRVGRNRRVDVEPIRGDPPWSSVNSERLDLVGVLYELVHRDVDGRETASGPDDSHGGVARRARLDRCHLEGRFLIKRLSALTIHSCDERDDEDARKSGEDAPRGAMLALTTCH